jgi:hypothetical protein
LRKAWEGAAEDNKQAQLEAKKNQYDKLVRQPFIKLFITKVKSPSCARQSTQEVL